MLVKQDIMSADLNIFHYTKLNMRRKNDATN